MTIEVTGPDGAIHEFLDETLLDIALAIYQQALPIEKVSFVCEASSIMGTDPDKEDAVNTVPLNKTSVPSITAACSVAPPMRPRKT